MTMFEACPPPYEASHTRDQQSSTAAQHRNLRPFLLRNIPSYRHQASSSGLHSDEKTPLDFTQRIERKLAEYNASQNVFKRWLFEIVCWFISAACMGAIIGIYIHIQETQVSQVSGLLSSTNVLGKIASAALIVPTTEALGQLKWNWFQDSKAMWDFEIFDKATRGPLGALMLLFRTKGRSLAALGAILILLLLAIDTFFQQVVTLPDRWISQQISGTIPRVIDYRPSFTKSYIAKYEIMSEDRQLAPVAKEFFYRNGSQPVLFGNGTRPDIPLSCPTSNCTWPPYETLAICSSCADVSDVINSTYTCLNMSIEWSAAWDGPLPTMPYPNGTVCGYFLNATSLTPILLSGYVLPEDGNITAGEALVVRAIPLTDWDTKAPYYGAGSINFKDVHFPIFDGLISSARDGSESVYRKESPIVQECMLTWCVHTLKSSYSWGVYTEETLSTYFEPVADSEPWPWESWEVAAGTWFSYMQNLTLTPPRLQAQSAGTVVTNDVYQIGNYSHTNIMNIFDDLFPSFYTAANIDTKPVLRHKNFASGPTVRGLDWNPFQYPNNITRHMERLATSMSNVVRASASIEMLQGKSYQIETYVSIQWAWLAFPLALLVLTLVFLVSTIIKTSRDGNGETGIWKTSAMPTLIYGLPKETQGQFVSSLTSGSGRGAPKKTRIKLMPNMGWRVSGQSYLSRSPRLPSGERVPRGWI